MASLAEHLSRIEPDQWRLSHEFSQCVKSANEELFRCHDTRAAEHVLNLWLSAHQPCLFGRSAARQGLLSHCVLFESDLNQPDEHIRQVIQTARTEWTRRGFRGERSGFIITAVSRRLAYAAPGPALKALAQRLCSLYLLDDIECDRVYLDDLFLQAPALSGRVWRWRAGVNYFATNGDGRWWQDHRIPGGIAFSINSVGHMARSGAVSRLLKEGAATLGMNPTDLPPAPIDTLDKALLIAMQTIAGASDAVSGKATSLRPLVSGAPESHRCPAHFPSKLQAFDKCEYDGFYHTDYTIPSEYFLPEVERPAHVRQWNLDFTYLADAGVDNPAGVTMGTGQILRGTDCCGSYQQAKRERSMGQLVSLANEPRLDGIIGTEPTA
ncbi:MAG: hypothetical protein H6814_08865 [Phycisphaeraceae bacterium]|nr:hypothetical protein [Phycisphaeraceae bacterium]